MNTNCEDANVNGSLPTATESKLKLYQMEVAAKSRMSLTGRVEVFAASADEAIKKVYALIYAEALDDDLEMEDYESRCIMPYSDVKNLLNVDFRIEPEGVDLVDPDDDDEDADDEDEAEGGDGQVA